MFFIDYLENLQKEVSVLLESIEGRQFMAHANSILEGEEATKESDQVIISFFPKIEHKCEKDKLKLLLCLLRSKFTPRCVAELD